MLDPLTASIVVILGKYALDKGLELGKEVGPQALDAAAKMFKLVLERIGKKKPEVMAKHRARFIEGATKNGVTHKTADKLFMLIEKFGGYGFNKSHSAAYAMIAYQTAYLKANYPVQFMAALLTQDMGNQDKTIKNIAECPGMEIKILPPDINESQTGFSVVEGKIRPSMEST